MSNQFKLSPPWITLGHQFDAMFGEDPDITVEYVAGDGNDPIIKLFVDGQDKADAIEQLLPAEYNFGGVTVSVVVIPANKPQTNADLFRRAFYGNPVFSFAAQAEGIFTNPITYVVFKNRVVQFWNDDLGDINGNETTLYELIAGEMFGELDGVSFCTDTPENLGKHAK